MTPDRRPAAPPVYVYRRQNAWLTFVGYIISATLGLLLAIPFDPMVQAAIWQLQELRCEGPSSIARGIASRTAAYELNERTYSTQTEAQTAEVDRLLELSATSFRRASECMPEGDYYLGQAYCNGLGVELDKRRGQNLIVRAVAADRRLEFRASEISRLCLS